MAEPVFRRLNPLTIVLELARVAGRVVYFFIYALITHGPGRDWVFEAIGGFVVVAAIARYYSFSFAVHDGHLLIHSGIITRRKRTIPLSKIQNINLSKNLIHRIFGLVDLKIETAAGAQTEASISALNEAEAEALKRELTQGVHQELGIEAAPEEVRGRTVYKISQKELLLAGATENRALAILATISGGSVIFQEKLAEFLGPSIKGGAASWPYIAVIVVVFLIIGWVFSIVSAIIAYGNFEVTLEGGKLRRHYGLINQIESVVPIPRVQLVRTSETLLQRALHLCKMYVETAGHYQKEDMHGSSLICPLLENPRLNGIAMTVLPGRPIDSVKWRSVSPWTIRTHAQVTFITLSILIGVLAYFYGWMGLWALVPAAAWAVFTGWVRYRTTGYDDRPRFLASRHGVFSRRTSYVPVEKIQSIALRQSPLQRRLGLSTVQFNTAATGHGGNGAVTDLPLQESVELAYSLHRRSAESVRLTGEVL